MDRTCDQPLPEQGRDVVEGALLRQRDHLLARSVGFGRGRLGAGVEQRQPRHALRGAAHHLESGIAAHRQATEGKARGRDREKPLGDVAQALVAVMLRDQNRAPRRQCGPLRRIEAGVATQPRDQHERFDHRSSAS